MSHSSFDKPIAIGPDPVFPRESAIEAAYRQRIAYLEGILRAHRIVFGAAIESGRDNRCRECGTPTHCVGLCEVCTGEVPVPSDPMEPVNHAELRQEQDAALDVTEV